MNLESIPLQAFLIVSSVLFCIGIWGLLNSRNAVRVLMSIELMLNAVNINLMAFSSYVDNNLIQGQVFTIFVIPISHGFWNEVIPWGGHYGPPSFS